MHIKRQRASDWGKSLLVVALLSTVPITAWADGETVSGVQVSDALQHPYVEGQLIVKFKEGVNPYWAASAGDAVVENTVSTDTASVAAIELAPGGTVASELAQWNNSPLVEYAEPNYIYKADAAASDPGYGKKWHISQIKANLAWDQNASGSGVTVAVLDTGVDLDHPDLVSHLDLANQYNATDNNATAPDDVFGHGTHVAGIIAASSNDSQGIAGVAPGVKIMPVKVLGDQGFGNTLWVMQGIHWAADHGAKIINMSLGGSSYSKAYQDAVDYAYGKGVLVIAAAGNQSTSAPHYPASLDHVMSVVWLESSNKKAARSNFGAKVDISAPGELIYSTYKGKDYTYMSGTSMATPVVSGVAALVLGKRPSLTPGQLEMVLKSSATDLGAKGRDNTFGYGLVDALKALTQPADSTAPGLSLGVSNPTGFAPTGKNSVKLTFSVTEPATVTMTVYDGSDTVVRTLLDKVTVKKAGNQATVWNGKNNSNLLVSNGTYTYKLTASDESDNGSAEVTGTLGIDTTAPTVTGATYEVYSGTPGMKISYELSEAAKVTAGIYNGKKLIKSLAANIAQNAGSNTFTWGGTDSRNKTVNDGTYTLKISGADSANNRGAEYTGNISVEVNDPDITAVSDGKDPLKLVGNAANTIKYTLSENATLRLYLYDSNDSIVRKLIDDIQTTPGPKWIKWNGKNDGGVNVADGTYTYKITATDVANKTKEVSGTITTDSAGPAITSLTVSPSSLTPNGTDNVDISFTMSEDAKVTLTIVNGAGKTVKTLLKAAAKTKGGQTVSWDGKITAQASAPAGSYTVNVTVLDSVGFSTSATSSAFTIQ